VNCVFEGFSVLHRAGDSVQIRAVALNDATNRVPILPLEPIANSRRHIVHALTTHMKETLNGFILVSNPFVTLKESLSVAQTRAGRWCRRIFGWKGAVAVSFSS